MSREELHSIFIKKKSTLKQPYLSSAILDCCLNLSVLDLAIKMHNPKHIYFPVNHQVVTDDLAGIELQ